MLQSTDDQDNEDGSEIDGIGAEYGSEDAAGDSDKDKDAYKFEKDDESDS